MSQNFPKLSIAIAMVILCIAASEVSADTISLSTSASAGDAAGIRDLHTGTDEAPAEFSIPYGAPKDHVSGSSNATASAEGFTLTVTATSKAAIETVSSKIQVTRQAFANAYATASGTYDVDDGTEHAYVLYDGDPNAQFSINGATYSGNGPVQIDNPSGSISVSASVFSATSIGQRGGPAQVQAHDSQTATLRLSFTGTPGSDKAPLIIGGVEPANDVTGSYLASFPVGVEGIGTHSALYTHFSSTRGGTAQSSLPIAISTNLSGFTIPLSSATSGQSFLLTINGVTQPYSPGAQLNFLADYPTGISSLTLASGDGVSPLPDVIDAAFTFTSPGRVLFSYAVPEPNTLVLGILGFVGVTCAIRRRRK